jgi:AcrR family transcriptional regulator
MAGERRSSEDRKRQIAEAALRILASQGAHRLTAMEIAYAVGVTDAAVFRHYRDKDEIVMAAVARFEELLEGDVEETGGDPLLRLGTFFVRRLRKARAHPEILRLAFNDRLAQIAGPEQAARVHQVISRSVAFVRGCLEEARRKRLVAADLPVELLVWTVIGTLRGAATSTAGHGASATPEALWAELEELLLRTRRARGRQ